MPDDRPEYKVYRSRPGVLSKLRGSDDLERLRRRPSHDDGADADRGRDMRGALRPGRLLRIAFLAVLGWLLLSLAVFMLSAQLASGTSPGVERALGGNGSFFTGTNVLVLGSDKRPKDLAEPGSEGQPGRADSILLLRTSVGQVRRLSVLRDSYANIPGQGQQKINAAYAFGGPALQIRTVEDFIGGGLEIDHVIEVSFADFPRFIDSLGGIDVTLRRCISSQPFGGRPFRLRRGEHHLNGRQALAFARVRKNRCSPNEDDRARARRQQQVMAAIRSRLLSPAAFVRLPWVAWQAPRTLRTDLAGPGLLGLFLDVVTGGSGSTRVLRPSADGPGGSLIVSEAERARAARYLGAGRGR